MSSSRRIDHLVLAVHDLDEAARFYEQLGFQVGVRNQHPWGTQNRLVQFESSFLELITVGAGAVISRHRPGFFSFGAFVAGYLRQREGLAMFVLDSHDAVADAAAFNAAGIGPFEPFAFERSGCRPDGSETKVAFTLAFAADDSLPSAAFFTCQQHYPEQFWNAQLQHHPNGASDVRQVTLNVADPADGDRFLPSFTGGVPDSSTGEYLLARGGGLQVTAKPGPLGFTGFSVAVRDLDGVAARLRAGQVRFTTASGALVLGPETGFGAQIGFVGDPLSPVAP